LKLDIDCVQLPIDVAIYFLHCWVELGVDEVVCVGVGDFFRTIHVTEMPRCEQSGPAD
jgi:hypothetical protein